MNGYITLDYELFMGDKTGTPEMCLIKPMNHLTAMLDKYGVKTNVFVDATYLLKMRELKDRFPQLQKDYESVTNHVKRLDAEGHAIQLHLHPQWCYSSFNGSKWVLDKDHYKLSDMPLEEQKQLIHESVQLLNSLVTRKVTAFRAGGYSIENFPELYDTFIAEGIIVDTSVLPGGYYNSKYQSYDYRKIPAKTSYSFTTTPKNEEIGGQLMEYPLSVKTTPYLFYAIKRLFKRSDFAGTNNKWGNGEGIGYPGGKKQMILSTIKKMLGNVSIVPYIEYGFYLEEVYDYLVKKNIGDDFIIIGHPKMLSPYSIECMELFIKNHPEIKYKLF